MYPVTYQAENPGEGRNRLTVFFRYILAIPLFIVAFFYAIVAEICAVIAWFSIVFTGQYPPGLYNFVAGYLRFIARATGYIHLMTDEYPPFNGEEYNAYPIRVGVPQPLAEYDRLKTGLRLIFAIPVILLAYVQGLIASVIAFIAWFAILFTGSLSEGLFEPLRSANAYLLRAASYYMLVTEEWPPFTLEASGAAPAADLPPAPPTAGAPAPDQSQQHDA
jgi:hypothetical protein